SASKPARPVAASPTSKPPASKPQRVKPTPTPKPAATPDAKAGTPAAEGNGAAARTRSPSQKATHPSPDATSASWARSALGAVASALRTVMMWCAGAVASALRTVVAWCGGGLPFAVIVFTVLGFADSVYLTVQHFTEATAFAGCSEHGAINCVAVTTSDWSRLPAGPSGGIPVSVAGLAFYVFMLAVNSPWGWRARWAPV